MPKTKKVSLRSPFRLAAFVVDMYGTKRRSFIRFREDVNRAAIALARSEGVEIPPPIAYGSRLTHWLNFDPHSNSRQDYDPHTNTYRPAIICPYAWRVLPEILGQTHEALMPGCTAKQDEMA